jgi:hypothetical protein
MHQMMIKQADYPACFFFGMPGMTLCMSVQAGQGGI